MNEIAERCWSHVFENTGLTKLKKICEAYKEEMWLTINTESIDKDSRGHSLSLIEMKMSVKFDELIERIQGKQQLIIDPRSMSSHYMKKALKTIRELADDLYAFHEMMTTSNGTGNADNLEETDDDGISMDRSTLINEVGDDLLDQFDTIDILSSSNLDETTEFLEAVTSKEIDYIREIVQLTLQEKELIDSKEQVQKAYDQLLIEKEAVKDKMTAQALDHCMLMEAETEIMRAANRKLDEYERENRLLRDKYDDAQAKVTLLQEAVKKDVHCRDKYNDAQAKVTLLQETVEKDVYCRDKYDDAQAKVTSLQEAVEKDMYCRDKYDDAQAKVTSLQKAAEKDVYCRDKYDDAQAKVTSLQGAIEKDACYGRMSLNSIAKAIHTSEDMIMDQAKVIKDLQVSMAKQENISRELAAQMSYLKCDTTDTKCFMNQA